MVRRNIVWSNRAKIKLFEILDYYTKRNESTTYSKKLYKKFSKELVLLNKQPDIGIKTGFNGIRVLIVNEYLLFYEIFPEKIVVLTIWDSRQNPDSLKIK